MKSVNIRVSGTLNHFFIKGSYTQIEFSKKIK